MTKTKRIQILCLLGAVTLLLSGCWTEAPVESANGLLGDQEPADQQEEVILPAAFTLPYDPDQTLDPVTCADGMQQVAGSLIYEGLFRLDRQLEPQPWLCQSYTYDAASLTYTFTLRSGVTFSDGSPLTAAANTASPLPTAWASSTATTGERSWWDSRTPGTQTTSSSPLTASPS